MVLYMYFVHVGQQWMVTCICTPEHVVGVGLTSVPSWLCDGSRPN